MPPRLLVPLDQSTIAESVLPLARTLAKQLGASVTLLSVLDVPASFGSHVRSPEHSEVAAAPPEHSPPTAMPTSPYGRWTGWTSEPSAQQIDDVANDLAAAERYLNAIAKTFDIDHVETMVRFGPPAEQILATAESREDTLIVLASHGRSGLGRVMIGSVAERVVQAARNPVFVVRGRQDSDGAGEYSAITRILLPVDGSTFSEQTIPVVGNVFGDDISWMHLINVIETPRFANQAQSEAYTTWLTEQVSAAGVEANWEVVQGSPATQITEAADRLKADLIAMSTHGRTGVDRFVLGSVAERVLQEAERPLLLVPARMSQ